MTELTEISLASTFRPVVWLYSEEDYFPCSPNYYLQNATLVDQDGNVTMDAPAQVALAAVTNKKAYLQLGKNARTVRSGNSKLDSPLFAIVRDMGNVWRIVYIFFYAYNGDYDIANLTQVGSHDADIEHITVEVDKQTKTAIRTRFSRHTSDQGEWVNGEVKEVFAAFHGHGLYAQEGVHIRARGFANDLTNRGRKWDAPLQMIYPQDHQLYDVNTMGWAYYPGKWGPEGVAGVARKSWFMGEEPETNSRPYVMSSSAWKGVVWTARMLILVLYVLLLVAGVVFIDNYAVGKRCKMLWIVSFIIIMYALNETARFMVTYKIKSIPL